MKGNAMLHFFVIAAILVPTLYASAQEQAPVPSYADGECWTYRMISKNYLGSTSNSLLDGDYEVCFSEGKFVQGSGSDSSDASDASKSRDGTWQYFLYMKDNRHLKFPLSVGQKWTETFSTEVRGTNRRVKRTSETKVVGVERVTTAAGTYEAFKIERGTWAGGRLASQWTYFYSAQTKSVVKYHYQALIGSTATREIELLRFRAAR
jgi:hypothetical protein